MSTLEIVLLLAGGLILIASFFVPFGTREADQDTRKLVEGEVKSAVNQQMDSIKGKIDDIVDETVNYAVEKTERSLERVSNEKIMAVSEYSDTVLEEINKNHNEVMFLYDMLNDKHKNLTTAVSKVEKTVKEAEQTASKLGPVTLDGDKASDDQSNDNQKQLSQAATSDGSMRKADMPHGTVSGSSPSSMDMSVKSISDRSHSAEYDDSTDQDEFVLLSPQTVSAKKVIKSKSKPGNPSSETPELDISFTKDSKKNGNNNERILEMHNQGKSNVAIAKELGLGVGEVKLVIDLFEGLI